MATKRQFQNTYTWNHKGLGWDMVGIPYLKKVVLDCILVVTIASWGVTIASWGVDPTYSLV